MGTERARPGGGSALELESTAAERTDSVLDSLDSLRGRATRPRRAPWPTPLEGRPAAPRRLLLIGGGPRPVEAMRRFAAWATLTRPARVLVVGWASREPWHGVESLGRDLEPHGALELDASPRPPRGAEERARFLAQVARATAIFFSGGDQARLMAGLDAPLARALRERHRAGLPLGGTSAGTAIMSPRMIAGGDPPVVRTGLGALPGTILDQHFLLRRREGRLLQAVRRHPGALGVGVDEGAALAVEDGRHAEVLGGRVALVRAAAPHLEVLEPGARFCLRAARRAPVPSAPEAAPTSTA